jgi:hypothetical protein
MARGQRRYGPPEGYMTSTEVIKLLGKTFYKHVAAGRITKVAPDGHTHGFYKRDDVQTILNAEQTFTSATRGGPLHNQDAVFTYATLGDMDALYACAKKFFPNPASAEIRRAWMRKEPRGHYLMKRVNDGVVVAYMYLLALKPQYLASYMHGELPGRMITPDHIERFEPGKPVEACIINAIQSDPSVEQELRSNYVAMLLRGVKHDMGMLGKEGIVFPYLYAWSETTQGIALCTRLGMEHWEEPKGKRCFFMLNMQETNASIMRDYKRGIAEWKQKNVSAAMSAPDRKPRQKNDQQSIWSQERITASESVSSDMPDGLIGWREYARRVLGKKGEAEVLKEIRAGRIETIKGEWKVGRAVVREALNEEGRGTVDALNQSPASLFPTTDTTDQEHA